MPTNAIRNFDLRQIALVAENLDEAAGYPTVAPHGLTLSCPLFALCTQSSRECEHNENRK